MERAGIAFRGIDTGQIRGINPVTALINIAKMVTGVRQSVAIVDEFRPHVCLVTGGYVCAPVVVACRLRHIPVLIYLPDIVPGWAIRALSYLAQQVAVTLPAAARYFGRKAVVTGYPVRKELLQVTGCGQLGPAEHAQNRAAVRRQLAERLETPTLMSDDLPLVLVWGGSQGARSINQALWQGLMQILPHAQVLHVVGERDWPLYQSQAAAQPLPAGLVERYHPVAYLHEEMTLALAAADATVARAGASSLGEFPVARLPALLVPLLGVNQLQNAEQLAERGGAVIVDDDNVGTALTPALLALVRNPTQRQAMEEALAQVAQPGAALAIARELQALCESTMGEPTTGESTTV